MNADQVVTAFCKAVSKGAVEEALSYLADDCLYHNIPLDPIQGKATIAQTLAGFGEALGTFDFKIVHQVASGNIVMNERIDTFSKSGYALPVAGIFEVKDGKIVSWRDYFDTRQFSKGTGLPI